MNLEYIEKYANILETCNDRVAQPSSQYILSETITPVLLDFCKKLTDNIRVEYNNSILNGKKYLINLDKATISISDNHTLVITGKIFTYGNRECVRYSSSIMQGSTTLISSLFVDSIGNSLDMIQDCIENQSPF